MHIIDILLIGIALSMDAFAVSVSDALIYKKLSFLQIALFFGIFQALMPLGGYFAGSFFADVINRFSGLFSLLILGFIGINMIWDACKPQKLHTQKQERLPLTMLFMQAIATSVDAFAIGISFVGESFMLGLNIYKAAALIGMTTFLLSLAACFIGRKSAQLIKIRPELIGGIILILIGLKAFLF